jgi:hypothetical protein
MIGEKAYHLIVLQEKAYHLIVLQEMAYHLIALQEKAYHLIALQEKAYHLIALQEKAFHLIALQEKAYHLIALQGTPVSPTNNTDCHDITEILLKMALSTINLNLNLQSFLSQIATHSRPIDIILFGGG